MIGAIAGAIGAVSSVVGAMQQGSANAAAAEASAEVAKANAKLVDELISDAIFRGQREKQQIVTDGLQVGARQRVSMAANGLDMNIGTPLDVIFSTQIDMFRDVDTSQRNTERELIDLEREKVNYTATADGQSRAADNYRTAGTIGAIGAAANSYASLTAPGGAFANIG